MRISNILIIFVNLLLLTYCNENKISTNSQQNDTITSDTNAMEISIDTLSLLKKGVKRDSIYLLLGLQYAEKLDTINSIKFIKLAYNLNPNYYLYSYLLGYFYYSLGKMDSAKKYLHISLGKNKEFTKTYYYLGGVYLAFKDYKKALQYFKNAFDREPLNSEYNYSLCLVYELIGKREKAKSHCLIAYFQDTFNIKAMHILSNIYLDEEKPDSALIFVDKILTIDSHHPLGRMDFAKYYHWKAHQLLLEEKFKESALWLAKAIHQYDLVLSRDTTYAEAYYNRGFAYLELKSYENAIKDFKKAIKYNPEDERPYFMLGSIYEYYKDYKKALEYYQKALEIKPDFVEAKKAIREIKNKL